MTLKAPNYDFAAGEGFRLDNLATARVPLQKALDSGSIEAVKRCALAGMGLAVLPKMAVTAELTSRPGPSLPVFVQMIRHRARCTTPALHALWSLVEQSFAKNP